jgi:arsenate reductase-like glutaredoxin family protein
MLDKLISDPKLLKQPLMRTGNVLQIGWDEAFWRDWFENQKS